MDVLNYALERSIFIIQNPSIEYITGFWNHFYDVEEYRINSDDVLGMQIFLAIFLAFFIAAGYITCNNLGVHLDEKDKRFWTIMGLVHEGIWETASVVYGSTRNPVTTNKLQDTLTLNMCYLDQLIELEFAFFLRNSGLPDTEQTYNDWFNRYAIQEEFGEEQVNQDDVEEEDNEDKEDKQDEVDEMDVMEEELNSIVTLRD